jgi:predicted metalloprotease with PDZ domain
MTVRLKLSAVAAGLVAFAGLLQAQTPVVYELRYSQAQPDIVSVTITLPEATRAPVTLIMPRSYPGGYQQVPYDDFVSGVSAIGPTGKPLPVTKDEYGPRWLLGQDGGRVERVEYRVDILRMETQLRDAISTSKVRKGYVGLLGYSVFAYPEGLAGRGMQLVVTAPQGWPVLSTLQPAVPAPKSVARAFAKNYDALADSEILMGPALQLSKLDGKIPLLTAIYAEGAVDAALEGRLARQALDAVQAYFGDVPIPQYTVQLELLRPLPGHNYGFSQEHIDSGTFTLSLDAAITPQSAPGALASTRANYAHHMAHSWIPKLVYGEGYSPYHWEMTPVIDTIWFNEGFGRYASISALADALPGAEGAEFRRRQIARFHNVVDTAPPFIRGMSLPMLSREASFLYEDDFRTGLNVFSRGSLMAAEMDDRIRSHTHGLKSLRDALRWLVRWSVQNGKPFQTEDLPRYFEAATGVDITDILERWLKPLE